MARVTVNLLIREFTVTPISAEIVEAHGTEDRSCEDDDPWDRSMPSN
jgi:hypothetical protein